MCGTQGPWSVSTSRAGRWPVAVGVLLQRICVHHSLCLWKTFLIPRVPWVCRRWALSLSLQENEKPQLRPSTVIVDSIMGLQIHGRRRDGRQLQTEASVIPTQPWPFPINAAEEGRQDTRQQGCLKFYRKYLCAPLLLDSWNSTGLSVIINLFPRKQNDSKGIWNYDL